jgi:hypothetical protein
MAEILRDRCLTDVAVSGATDCPDIFAGYARRRSAGGRRRSWPAPPRSREVDAGSTRDARGEAGRDAAAVAARLAANRQADAGGCAIMKDPGALSAARRRSVGGLEVALRIEPRRCSRRHGHRRTARQKTNAARRIQNAESAH